jgi:hypothetical protein
MGVLQRWENGSDFYWPSFAPLAETSSPPWRDRVVYAGSGRDAIRCLLLHGMARRGWQRIWIPTYFCQEVAWSIASTGIEVCAYRDNPLQRNPAQLPDMKAGDVLYVVNYFGLRSAPRILKADGVEVVEDHSHDPWSHWAFDSTADYCVASLRKTLPIPDGAVLWSPRAEELPPTPAPTPTRQSASAQKLAAMLLKLQYLEGKQVDKQVFLDLARQGETEIAAGDISGMSQFSAAILPTLPIGSWRAQRQLNQQRLSANLGAVSWATVLSAEGDGTCPFAGVVISDTAARCAHIRRGLIAQDVYPAVLWPLQGSLLPAIPDTDRQLAVRLLSLHCDMRYSSSDMDRVADLLIRLGDACPT